MKNRTVLWNSPFKPIRQNYQLVLVCLGVLLSGYVTAQNPTPNYIELEKGLIIDLDGDVGYVMNPDGTMSSLDLANGQNRWNTYQKGKPLAFVDNQLLVQLEDSVPSNEFNLGYLNNASGLVVRSQSRTLPSSIKSRIKSTINYSFDTRVRIVNSQVNLSWNFELNNFKGIDTENGKISDSKGVFLVNKTTLNMGNLGINNFSMANQLISDELDNNKLANVDGRQFSSIQDDYVVAIERVSNDSQWKKYKWTIYKRNGTRVGSIRSNLSFRPFYVVDNTLVFTTVPVIRNISDELIEEPKSLVGYDLTTGNQKWTKEILDLEYRGPYPP